MRTLGVTPAEPGFATARIAPRLGDLAWARGTVPTPFGPLTVEAKGDHVSVDSPVPFVLDRGDGAPTQHPASVKKGTDLFVKKLAVAPDRGDLG